MRRRTCCFSGNRSDKLPWGANEEDEKCIDIKEKTKELIECAIKNGYEYFLTGMSIGYDMICAEIILSLQKINMALRLFYFRNSDKILRRVSKHFRSSDTLISLRSWDRI